ncbi:MULTISPECIES: cell division protein FtsQ/DivIB [Kocuria]|uniref:Cell division protein FtsQ n=2 Tax=Kocuria TaxID=57493 RepID=A0A7D7Q5C1_KOCVA|nr:MULTISPECIES: FtsQ-type POTRA domain-containing protein [Kocuria]MDN5631616.1 cell division protein FtsQ/DivIB [Kocuria sp.]QMS56920.1 Cell division protein FtsQ [Kocuria varians]RUP84765.1 FtsQ-type POTRA domain-containing protein [Kocuria sp. HSID17590]RUQ10311.1 FtsQ-type POTRA domain-containing protein [Kocuria sp. HSID17582]
MARSLPPHQPSFGGRASDDAHSEDPHSAAPGSDGHGSEEDSAAAARPDERDPERDADWDADWGVGPGEEFHGVADEPPVVRVNDGAKVTRVDTGQLEAAPAAGGRFSTWRARRRAARAEEAAAGSTGEPEDGDGEDADSTVLQFPPSTHRRRRRRRLITLLVSLAALALLALVVFFSPLFATRTIDVEGATLTNPDAVQEALSGFQGVPLTRISKQDVRESLGDVPQVKSVDVVFHPPHTIAVQLHERVGVAVVEDGDSLVLVDSEGKPLSTVAKAQRPDVPLVSGGRGVLSTQKFTDVSEVLAALPAEVLSRLESAAAPSGSAVELTFKDGRKVLWGDASQSDLKAQVVAALVNSEATANATEIDVSAPLHPVVK